MQYLNNAFVSFFEFLHTGIYGLIPNKNVSYGLAIILMTLIIKIIVFPLTMKQMKSSFVMTEMQPEIKKIQDKYKNDPQKVQQEMMKLYKDKGASPLSGCLPMLIQWPLLVALYYVFRTLTGISGVSFIHPLIIPDLSKSHNIILAVLAGATAYYSGALMMPSGDSAQAKQSTTMNISMSVFMVVITWQLTSALGLYMIASNLIQVAQTALIKKIHYKRAPVNQ